MSFRFLLSLVLVSLVLSACATHQKTPGATFDRIGQELQASANPKALDAALNQAMLPPLQLESPLLAENREPRFDLVVNNAPASQVFMALVSDTRYSMMVAPELSGTVTVNLKNVTVREALETLRELYGYEFKFQGTRIYIQPNTLQTRLFQINYLAGKRQGQSDVRVTSGSISSAQGGTGSSSSGAQGSTASGAGSNVAAGPPSSQIQTTQNSDFWHDLNAALSSIVGTKEGRQVIVTPGSGVVVVKAFPADLRNVENYLRMTQLIAERQVMLEAKIIEVALNEGYQSGVNWNHFGGRNNRFAYGPMRPGTTLNTAGPTRFQQGATAYDPQPPVPVADNAPAIDTSITGRMNANGLLSSDASILPGIGGIAAATSMGNGFIGLAFQGANFAALLNFLETQGNVQVLSSPRIATINNQKAVLKVGNDEFFVTNVSSNVTSTGSSNVSTPTITLQPFFSGIALDVTPQIDDENNVVLHVHPSISVVTEKQKTINLGSMGTYTLPLANSSVNETDSIVRVQDGNIVAIGGLIKQEQSADANGLPGTTDSPLGLLFGARNSYLRKHELVILIKPTIIRNESSWREDLSETQNRIRQLDPRRPAP